MGEVHEKRPHGGRRRGWVVLGLVVAPLLGVRGIGTLGQAFGGGSYLVPTNSMAPRIRAGDRIQADVGIGDPRRGEVWVFHGPPRRFPRGSTLIKRVVGLPGERVEVADGRVLIDGRPLPEPYLATPPTYTMAPQTLGPGEYFMLGDNRNASNDSHAWGVVPRDQFLGRVRLRYWPPNRLGGF
jgi:signal peptidase I